MRTVLITGVLCFAMSFALAAAVPSPAAAALKDIETAAAASHSDAVLIETGGKTLLSTAADTADPSIQLMSATKSVVALAIGLLLDDGKLASIDEPVSTVYPEWAQGRKRDITVRMLMDHTSGLQNIANAGVELEGAPDLVKLALGAELSAEPGSTFSYNNKAANLLPGIVERLAGIPMDLYLNARLFKPLGISSYRWMKDTAGTPMGMSGLVMSATDLARIGRLMLDGGLAPDGTRLLSEQVVALLTAESARSPEVGLLWWRVPAWERYTLRPEAASYLSVKGVAADVRQALLSAEGKTFNDKSELTAFLAQKLGPSWPQQYGTEITGRGIRLVDIFELERGPVKAYAANGYLGQHLVVVPEKNLVAVRLVHRKQSHASPLDDYAAFPADVLRLAQTL